MNCTPKLGRLNKNYAARDCLRNSSGVSPFSLTWRPRVPMDHEVVEVRLEGLEVRPRPSAEELVLDVAEHLLRRAVVDTVALPGHALHHAGLLQPPANRPAGTASPCPSAGSAWSPWASWTELVEQLVLLGHVGVSDVDQATISCCRSRRPAKSASPPGLLELGESVTIFSHGPSRGRGAPRFSDPLNECTW